MSRKTENEAWHAGFTACANEHARQRREPEYPITREVPERYRWSQDYNEMLISQAGGDGDNAATVVQTVIVDDKIMQSETLSFTNVPMHRVHAAIALLNDDGERMTPYDKMLFNAEYAKNRAANAMHDVNNGEPWENPLAKFYPPYAAPGTKEFTTEELFPRVDEPLNVDGDPCGICRECGAVVSNPVKHVTWHNKTLP